MSFVFVDTETSGFISQKKGEADQAWVCQLACLLTDEKGNEISSYQAYVKPEGRTIHEGASAVHGLTAEFCAVSGELEEAVASTMTGYLRNTAGIEAIIIHNASFDIEHINYMCARAGVGNELLNYPIFCTMKNTVDLCQLPFAGRAFGKQKYKWPKLTELHKELFGRSFDGAHDAMADVEALARCFFTEPVQDIYNTWKNGGK